MAFLIVCMLLVVSNEGMTTIAVFKLNDWSDIYECHQ